MRFASPIALAIASLSVIGVIAACSSDPSDAPPGTPDGGDEALPNETGADAGPDTGLPPPGPADAKSGTRIQALYHDTDDGYSVFATLHDTKLDVDCYIQNAEDGAPRCLPRATAAVVPALYGAGCTANVAQIGKVECTPVYADTTIETPGNPCAPKVVRYRIGAKATGVFTKDSGGGCIAAPVSIDQDYYELGAKVDPADLVLFHYDTAAITATLGRRIAIGEDGSRAPTPQLVDVARAQPCRIRAGSDDKLRCVPDTNIDAAYFDVGCTTPVGHAGSCIVSNELHDDTVAYVFDARPDCSRPSFRAHLFPVGAKHATKDYYSGTPGTCAGPVTGTADIFDLGTELPATTFPEVALEKRGGTKLQAGVYTSAGVVVDLDSSSYDVATGEACFIEQAGDGKLRCIPTSGAFAAGQYSDSECKNALAVDTSGCTPIVHATKAETVGCESHTRSFTVGAKEDIATTQVYSTLGGAGCTGPTTPGSGVALYPLVTELDALAMVEVHLVAH